ncbi:MAG: hypothetical protein ACLFUS_17870 [Candidatus Sumerlaeia bacterium]
MTSMIIWMMAILAMGGISMSDSHVWAQETADWFAFEAVEDFGPSVIGMEDWLDAPAGVHGPVRMVDDRFEFGNGQAVKFWGVNLGNADCAPKKEWGAHWAKGKAKYGVNCVRLHKFIGTGGGGIGDPQDSTKYTEEGLDRLDYFCAEMKKRGIYYGWSWIFEHSVRPADREKLVAYDEIKAAGGSTQRVALFIGEDIQDLRIEMLMNLLNHKNPYTGLTYAEDPALAFIEFQNEDSIFFYSFGGFNKLDEMPTYKKMFNQRFSEWLKQKYGNHEGLVEAWGEKALNLFEIKDENLAKENIMVQGNPWFFSPEGLEQARSQGSLQRMIDTAAFLHHAQDKYYTRFHDAIRQAGYDGPLVGSCWTTPAGLPQYLNLHNDYQVGFIDRHSYFGKGTHKWRPQPGNFSNEAQVDKPGSGLLSSGLLQVKDRPFALSEWTSVFPNEWNIESPTIIAAYGLGLQGWDASYDFASHIREYEGHMFATRTSDPRLWVVDVPHQIGLYPVLARMIYRGDVKESEIISTRRVSLDELYRGKPDWMEKEKIEQSWDFKEYDGVVPSQALAAGRVVVDFVEKAAESDLPDMEKFVKDRAVHSVTNQLVWHGADGDQRGYITIDTPGTKAVMGFLPDKFVRLSNVEIESSNRFAGIYMTALEKDKTLADSKSILIMAIARVRNTDMEIDGKQGILLEVGKSPMIIEPVQATLRIDGRLMKSIQPLDHGGRRTGRKVPVSGNQFQIDTGKDKAFYYLLEM